MDVLSSQSNLAGYKAVLDAAAEFGRAFPMMMTAAGTVSPARVMVMGAGVAGLQAIATARRLGAIVSATDVRLAAKEQVESLGATFLMVDSDESKAAETSGGYAREMSVDYQRRQAVLIAETLKKQDVVICTALIPGRAAPRLVTEEMVRSMKPGSVVVDLAVEQGGNCEKSEPGKVVLFNDVKIVGHRNVPSRLPVDASALYARNVLNFVTLLTPNGALNVPWDDEIVKAVTLTRDGNVVHPQFV
jgi:NAD(P) transhydrogenase subunit alpha